PGELRHAHAVTAGPTEQRHDAVLRHADAERRQPRLDLTPEAIMRVEQALPGVFLQRGQARCGHGPTVSPPPRSDRRSRHADPGIGVCADTLLSTTSRPGRSAAPQVSRQRSTTMHDTTTRRPVTPGRRAFEIGHMTFIELTADPVT